MEAQVVIPIPPSPLPDTSTTQHAPFTSASLLEYKTTFLRHQTRLLSAPLRVSPAWHDQNSSASEFRIPDTTVAEITEKVNRRVAQHAKRVYGTQSVRHVAEQIDALYFRDVARLHVATTGDTTVQRTTELSALEDRESVLGVLADDALPVRTGVADDEGLRYVQLRQRLGDLVERRNQLRRQVQQTEQVKEMVAPFENASVNVQGNLVSRDGELQNELRRMRVLMARVSQKLGELRQDDATSNVD